MSRLLLLSNSTNPGTPYLEWARDRIASFLTGERELLFVPWASVRIGWDEYTDRVAAALRPAGLNVHGIHRVSNAMTAVQSAKVIVIGGGNTFQLLRHIQDGGLIGPIRERVAAGAPYIGWSAGSNVACPTIRTTNDMPIVEPAGFRGLALVPFQINPHYTDATIPNHGGETRRERLAEFVDANPGVWVAGLREGSLIEVQGEHVRLGGDQPVTIFGGRGAPVEHGPGADLGFLMLPPA